MNQNGQNGPSSPIPATVDTDAAEPSDLTTAGSLYAYTLIMPGGGQLTGYDALCPGCGQGPYQLPPEYYHFKGTPADLTAGVEFHFERCCGWRGRLQKGWWVRS
jgi:hypothetical protein